MNKKAKMAPSVRILARTEPVLFKKRKPSIEPKKEHSA